MTVKSWTWAMVGMLIVPINPITYKTERFLMKAKILLNEDSLMEMATVGEIKGYTIIVWMNDNGNIPHFHVVDSNTLGKQFHTCIEIQQPKYFHHNGKEDVLNSKLRKELMSFFSAKDPDGVFSTNWDALLYEWNKNNRRKTVDRSLPLPDYTQLQ